jgi:hypothetical protein
MAAVHFGTRRDPIQVHEDLLCTYSPFFRTLLQPNRKPIEDLCSVCQYDLETTSDNITYCKSCGQNIHKNCIDNWLDQKKQCPICRRQWVKEIKNEKVVVKSLDPEGFNCWVQCAYGSSDLPKLRTVNGKTNAEEFDEHIIELAKAWAVGNILEDTSFRNAVTAQIAFDVEKNDQLPGKAAIEYLWEQCYTDENLWRLRHFFVDLYVLKWRPHEEWWYDHLTMPWVFSFIKSLMAGQALAKKDAYDGDEEPDMTMILDKWELEEDEGE